VVSGPGSIGRISPEKGPDRAIQIARTLGIPLKIAAKVDKVDEAYFREKIAPLLGDPGVEFIGEINEHSKTDSLGEAQALLFPIDWPEAIRPGRDRSDGVRHSRLRPSAEHHPFRQAHPRFRVRQQANPSPLAFRSPGLPSIRQQLNSASQNRDSRHRRILVMTAARETSS
jgi:hypothetical protein